MQLQLVTYNRTQGYSQHIFCNNSSISDFDNSLFRTPVFIKLSSSIILTLTTTSTGTIRNVRNVRNILVMYVIYWLCMYQRLVGFCLLVHTGSFEILLVDWSQHSCLVLYLQMGHVLWSFVHTPITVCAVLSILQSIPA